MQNTNQEENSAYMRKLDEVVKTWPESEALAFLYATADRQTDLEREFWARICVVTVEKRVRADAPVWPVIERAWSLFPERHVINLIAAVHALDTGDYARALGYIPFCNATDPETAFILGCALEGLKMPKLAVAAFQRGQSLAPQQNRFAHRIARIP